MKKKIILISLIFVMFMFAFTSTLHAADLGKINFVATNSRSSKAIENLEVSIYKVTGADEDGNSIMEIGFENCEIDIDDLSEENLENLKTFAKSNAQPLFTKTTDSNGKFTLENLEMGRYLLVQESQTEAIKMQTMLIMLPELTVENGLRYEITAKPKINEVIPETPDIPLEDELPATGTLDWLVPVLTIAGLVIFCIAWLKVYTTSKKKSKLAIFSMIFAIILLVLAAILLFYNTRENDRVEKDNLETVTELERLYEENLATQEDSLQNQDNSSTEKKTSININGYDYMGIIYIPILDNLALPVLENYTYSNLKVSVCKYSGGIEEGNFTIAGHNYKSSFGKLSKLSVGNIAYFKDANGIVYKYTCTKIETLSPNQVEEMTTGDWNLTLFTCTYNNANRLAYRFELM